MRDDSSHDPPQNAGHGSDRESMLRESRSRNGLPRHTPTLSPQDESNSKKPMSWSKIGAAFPRKDGVGLSIELKVFPARRSVSRSATRYRRLMTRCVVKTPFKAAPKRTRGVRREAPNTQRPQRQIALSVSLLAAPKGPCFLRS